MANEILKSIQDAIIDKDGMWMIANSFKWLLKYDFLKEELELIARYPETIGKIGRAHV